MARAALNVLKLLSNELRISLVAAGTSEALYVMQTDAQIASRFEAYALPAWRASQDLRRFIAGFLQQVDVPAEGIVDHPIAMEYMLDLTWGITGRLIEVTRRTALSAFRKRSHTVGIEHLQEVGKQFAGDLGAA